MRAAGGAAIRTKRIAAGGTTIAAAGGWRALGNWGCWDGRAGAGGEARVGGTPCTGATTGLGEAATGAAGGPS